MVMQSLINALAFLITLWLIEFMEKNSEIIIIIDVSIYFSNHV